MEHWKAPPPHDQPVGLPHAWQETDQPSAKQMADPSLAMRGVNPLADREVGVLSSAPWPGPSLIPEGMHVAPLPLQAADLSQSTASLAPMSQRRPAPLPL